MFKNDSKLSEVKKEILSYTKKPIKQVKRKPKTKIPDELKTEKYYKIRRVNNKAAKISRDKKRLLEQKKVEYLQLLREKNIQLKQKIKDLEDKLELLQYRKKQFYDLDILDHQKWFLAS